jgi:hypothetical protein
MAANATTANLQLNETLDMNFSYRPRAVPPRFQPRAPSP